MGLEVSDHRSHPQVGKPTDGSRQRGGVSTRRVEGLVQAMGLTGTCKSQVSELAKELDEAADMV